MIEFIKKTYKKYETFLKYIFVAGISFVIDILFFNIFNNLISLSIIISTICARVISSFINYLLNRDKVFKSDENKLKTVIKYYILVIIQMSVSAIFVDNLYKLVKINPTIIKIPVEFTLFICNYIIQKVLIFKKGNHEKNK